MKLLRLLLIALSAALLASACDCGGKKDPCDCVPSVEITQPGSTVLTEFHDTNAAEAGVQYPVSATTICIPESTVLTFSNDQRPGENVQGSVVMDDLESQTGHIEFSDQTFEDGSNRVCISGSVMVNRNTDGMQACDPVLETTEDCSDVNVQLGIPACRFDNPTDGELLGSNDDSSAAEGFQHDVQVACKGVNDGSNVVLLQDGAARIPFGQLSNGQVNWDDVDLAEGNSLLRVETTGSGGEDVAAEISVTVDTGGCAVRLQPESGTAFGADDDEDPDAEGLQVTLTVSTDQAGTFACASGSTVDLYVSGEADQMATLQGQQVSFLVTLEDGNIPVYAEVSGTSSGRSLTNNYLVCATPLEIAIESPGDGLEITDSADRDPVEGGIQVAVSGTSSGIATAEEIGLLVDGEIVMDGAEPLRPAVFFPGGEFEFQYASFLQSRDYTIQVRGANACGDVQSSPLHTITAQTEQRTCQITDPIHNAVLLAADDKDGDEGNDLQYDVQVNTANVTDGATYTLFISGQSPVSGLVINNNLSVNEITFTDGLKILSCVLDTGEDSPPVTVVVDGHSPTIEITSPGDGANFETTDITVDLATTGVEDGQLATVTVAWTDSGGTDHEQPFTATVTDNVASVDVTLGTESGVATDNTLTATVSDLAGNPAAAHSIVVTAQVFEDPPVITFIDPDETGSLPVVISEGERQYTVIMQVDNLATGNPVELVVVDNGVEREAMYENVSGTGFATFAGVLLPRGSVELHASATNAAGTGTGAVTLTVGDTSLPLVIVTDPVDGSYSQLGTFDVSIDSDVEEGQTCYVCSRSPAAGVPPVCDAGTPSIGDGLADADGDAVVGVTRVEGEYEIWASCTNLTGDTGTSLPNRVVIDETPPTVEFLEPADEQVYNAASTDRSGQPGFQIRVRVSADVEDGQGATLTVDGSAAELIGSDPLFDSNLITFAAVTVGDQADHELGVEVCDKAGNCASATPVTITVDRMAPDVVMVDPVDLDRIGGSADESGAVGFQYDVSVEFTDATDGDTVVLERNVDAGGWEQVASHPLTAGEASGGYVFDNATLIATDDSSGDPTAVQIRATITDIADNSDTDQVAIEINRQLPEVIITRPDPDQNFNIFSDMSSDEGFQTQVNVETHHTAQGDLLVLCADPGTGYPEGHCAGYGNEVWAGTVTGVTTYLTGVELDQGDNTLVAFAENIPGQGNYSDPVTVHVDSEPPTVVSVVVNSDGNTDGCINQEEDVFQATVTVSGVEDGRQLCLLQDWPPGSQVACTSVTAGVAVFGQSLGNGDYNLTARVTDAFGNPNVNQSGPVIEDDEAHFAVTVDTVPPVIAVSQPTKTTLLYVDDLNHGTQDLDFNFAATTDAEQGQIVHFEIDTSEVDTAAVSGGTASVQAAMDQGDHSLTASVADLCGNQTTSDPKDVFVDTVLPTVSCSQPTDDSMHNTLQVPFVCDTTGTDSTQQITVESSSGGIRCTPQVDGSGTTSFDCGLQEADGQTITVTVTDPNGNVSEADTISNVSVDVTGCSIVFSDYSGQVRLNASDDTVPGGDLQLDIEVCSPGCTSTDCPDCSVILEVGGSQVGSAQPLDAVGCTTFGGVTFVHQEMGTLVYAEIDDGAGNVNDNQFTVQMVDLVAPELVRDVPGANGVVCVAADGNPDVNGSDILADKVAGGDCQMDFTFTVTDGDFDQVTYPVTLTIEEGGAPIVTPASLTSSPQQETFTNTDIGHDAIHTLMVTATDYAGNETTLQMQVEADVIAPGEIVDAAAALGAAPEASRHADVDLGWTAVGDDGATGTASGYAIRWARTAITNDAEWDAAEEISNVINPAAPTNPEAFTASWLPPLNTYHIAIRSVDEVGNHGPIPADTSLDNLWDLVSHTGPGGNFGYNVWNVGDINDDDRDDLVVSAITLDAGAGSNEGAIFVFYGEENLDNWSSGGTPQQINRGVAGELFGFDVCGKGDLDGDTIPDVVVTGFGFDGSRGRATIYFGQSGSELTASEAVEIRPPVDTATQLGRSAEIIGDIDNDGIDDLFLGAPTADSNGRGYIFFGKSRDEWKAAATASDSAPHPAGSYIPLASASITILGVDADDWFSYRHGATTLGDVDGDGHDDFALVASGMNELYTFDGATISLITGSDVDPATDSVDVLSYAVAVPDAFMAGYGHRAMGGVDITGDSVSDLVVTDAYSHRVYLHSGVDNTPDDPPVKIDPTFTKRIIHPENINTGWDLDLADVNLDGLADVAIGTNSSTIHGVFVYYNTGVEPYLGDYSESTLVEGAGNFGIGLAIGDFDGDGLPDIAVGSLEGTPGMLYLFF